MVLRDYSRDYMNTYKIIRKKARGQENMVYLYLSYRPKGSQTPELTSLKISLPQEFLKGSPNNITKIYQSLPKKYLNGFNSVDELNKYLEEELLKAQSNLHPSIIRDRLFTSWANKYVESILNQGTKMRYRNILTLLQKFSKQKNKRDFIQFKELDINFIRDFNNWLITERKNNSTTTQYKLKAFKALINHSIKQKYSFPIHPFLNYKFKSNSDKNKVLSLEELKRLIKIDFKEVYRRAGKKGLPFEPNRANNRRYKPRFTLNEIRDYFIFQVLANGLRMSDLLTLRWNNFLMKEGQLIIKKRMVKTQNQIEIIVNEKALAILSKTLGYSIPQSIEVECFIEPDKVLEEIIERHVKPSFLTKEEAIKRGLISKEPNNRNKRMPFNSEKKPRKEYLEYFAKYENGLKYYTINQNHIEAMIKTVSPNPLHQEISKNFIKPLLEIYEKELGKILSKLEKEIKENTISTILKYSKEKEYSFVFPILKDENFKFIKKEEDFYTMNEDCYRKFQSGRTYYNKALKLIAEQANINIDFSSHVARHSYASLLLEMGEKINLFDIMTSLGHTRLTTTQTYLKSLSNKKLKIISNEISSKF